MKATEVHEDELHAFVDGQLARGRCTAVLAYLGRHPEEVMRLAAYARQKEELRDRLEGIGLPTGDPTTADLQRMLADRLSGRPRYREWLRRAAAMVAFVCLGWWSNTLYEEHLAERLPDVVVEALQAHQIFSGDINRPVELAAETGMGAWFSRCLEAAQAHQIFSTDTKQAVEFTASAETDMETRFSRCLGEYVDIPSLHSVGLRLVGARLLAGDDGPVAQLIYEDRDHYRLTLGMSVEPTNTGSGIEMVTLEGLTAGYWHEGDLTYALIGQRSKEQLLAIASHLGADPG